MDSYQEDRVHLRKTFLRGNPRQVIEYPVTHINTVREYLEQGFHSKRGGVILLTDYRRRINYGLGVDIQTRELTDFGGKIRPFENSIVGALREFSEETLGILETPSLEEIQDCIVIHNEFMLVLFVRVEMNPVGICHAFSDALRETLESGKKSELAGIMFYTETEFLDLLHYSRNIYSKLAWFLCGVKNFYQKL